PAAGHTITALDALGLAAALHRGAGEVFGALTVNLVGPLLRQTQHHQLTDRVIGDVPADRTATRRKQLADPQKGQRIGFETAIDPRDQQAIEAGLPHFLDKRRRHALLALDLVLVA